MNRSVWGGYPRFSNSFEHSLLNAAMIWPRWISVASFTKSAICTWSGIMHFLRMEVKGKVVLFLLRQEAMIFPVSWRLTVGGQSWLPTIPMTSENKGIFSALFKTIW